MSPDVTTKHQPWGATACGFARHGSRNFRSSTLVWGDGLGGCWFTSHWTWMDLMILNHRKLSAFNYVPMKSTLEATQPLVLHRSIVARSFICLYLQAANDVNPKRKVYQPPPPPFSAMLALKEGEQKQKMLWNFETQELHGTPNFLKPKNKHSNGQVASIAPGELQLSYDAGDRVVVRWMTLGPWVRFG